MDSFKLRPVKMCSVMAKIGMPLEDRKTRHVVLESLYLTDPTYSLDGPVSSWYSERSHERRAEWACKVM
jgi:hypothetical protein